MNPLQILSSSLVQQYSAPVLVMNTQSIMHNMRAFNWAMPAVEINYAVKCNPHKNVLQTIHDNGGSFDVASIAEVEMLTEIEGVDFSRVLYSNPVRPIRYITRAAELGVRWFVVDSIHEADKVHNNCPDAQLYIRLIVPNEDSQFPLTGKFGVDLDDAKKIVDHCAANNISLRGVSFHVGSQCCNVNNWKVGIDTSEILFDYMKSKGLNPDFLDLGGGYPVFHNVPVPFIGEIGIVISHAIRRFGDNIRVVAEPGRFMVSDAGHMLCQVVSRNIRNGVEWIYLDVGVFHGLIEMTVDGFDYSFVTADNQPERNVAIAGSSCDSLDIVKRSAPMPVVQDGQFIVVKNAGAYTTTYGTYFNGFPPPSVLFVSDK